MRTNGCRRKVTATSDKIFELAIAVRSQLLFFLLALFFPPLGIVGLIFVYFREALWLVSIGCIAVVFVEPLAFLENLVALSIAAHASGAIRMTMRSMANARSTIAKSRSQILRPRNARWVAFLSEPDVNTHPALEMLAVS
jgi:hypothetical protein